MDTPLSRSSVTLQLEAIQKRCAELIDGDGDDELQGLSLEEPVEERDDQQQYCIER